MGTLANASLISADAMVNVNVTALKAMISSLSPEDLASLLEKSGISNADGKVAVNWLNYS